MEQFIDTPVKHYSSGMYLRLAFAVAAHLEPEILIVDEVLAVGDARFQKKCLTKMSAAGYEGRTVLFVSHNMGTIARLCPRAMLLEGGRLVKDGPANEVVSAYLHGGTGTTAVREFADPLGRGRRAAPRGAGADGGRVVAQVVDVRQSVTIEMEYDVLRAGLPAPAAAPSLQRGGHPRLLAARRRPDVARPRAPCGTLGERRSRSPRTSSPRG